MPRWDELESALVEEGVAPRYAQRLIEELADHRAALVDGLLGAGVNVEEAQRSADEALGDLETIFTTALASPTTRSLARTQPSLFFLVGPLASALVAVALGVGAATGLAWVALNLLGWAENGAPFHALARSSYTLIAFGILPGLAFLFCAQAWLSRTSMRWALVACVALATLGGVGVLGYHVPAPGGVGGTLQVGQGWEPRVLRCTLPLLTFLAFTWLMRSERATAMLRSLRRFAV